jgi:hypothetical protein
MALISTQRASRIGTGSEQKGGLETQVAGFTRGGSEYGYLQFRVERTAYRCITGRCLFPRGKALELDCTHVVDRDWRVWLIYWRNDGEGCLEVYHSS